ncbi:MAG: hypothetical protein M1828_006373 [Chrysothrix sp. TS-e1954]|nr:MAG: hypothetical protein M1828_006373 [Chrysothrix sp. TS-e1954]
MGYILYGLSLAGFIFVTLLYLARNTWMPYVPSNISLPESLQFSYNPVPSTPSTFHDDAAAGLHSSNFDLSTNIEAADGRAGLDESGKREVQRIMKRRQVNFDEARRMVMMERFRREGVAEDGRPRDPKFVSFS